MAKSLFERIKQIQKRAAIREYILELPPLLTYDHGKAEAYTPEQILDTSIEAGLSMEYARYAIALFSSLEEFNVSGLHNPKKPGYWTMRLEIGEMFFRGNGQFTYFDIVNFAVHEPRHELTKDAVTADPG